MTMTVCLSCGRNVRDHDAAQAVRCAPIHVLRVKELALREKAGKPCDAFTKAQKGDRCGTCGFAWSEHKT